MSDDPLKAGLEASRAGDHAAAERLLRAAWEQSRDPRALAHLTAELCFQGKAKREDVIAVISEARLENDDGIKRLLCRLSTASKKANGEREQADYWTEERMRNATPVDEPGPLDASGGASNAPGPGEEDVRSTESGDHSRDR